MGDVLKALGDGDEPLQRVADFVDDDLLSCFLWAAGENAVAQPGWESPSVNPLKGIPLPPSMPPLPPAGAALPGPTTDTTLAALGDGGNGVPGVDPCSVSPVGAAGTSGLGDLEDLDDDDIAGLNSLNQSSGPLSKEQKLTQRMQRKAESARVARLRKKEYVSGLEQEVAKLRAELVAAREEGQRAAASAAAPPSAEPTPPSLREEGQRQLSQMDELLRRPTRELESFVPEVNATVEKYVANKRAQQETINEYLDCIEDILSPGTPMQVAFSSGGLEGMGPLVADGAPASSSMLSAASPKSTGPLALALTSGLQAAVKTTEPATVPPPAVKQEPADCSNGAAAAVAACGPSAASDEPVLKRQRRDSVGSQLLETLSTELGLTSAQVDALSGQKGFIHSDREMKGKCMQLMKELRTRISEHIGTSQAITDCLRRILTPVQVAKFLMWVEKNQRSMDLLNAMLHTDAA
mmetsp:Transcript_76507/g.127515  ORF Transcript_76507/g.127515 Transcript_76507/m.127515 type:complete len:466 (+) Transcript_76507:67-1464(+)